MKRAVSRFFIARAALRALIAVQQDRATRGGWIMLSLHKNATTAYDFVAINRLTRRVFVKFMPAKTGAHACRFQRDLHSSCPIPSAKMRAVAGKRVHRQAPFSYAVGYVRRARVQLSFCRFRQRKLPDLTEITPNQRHAASCGMHENRLI